VTRLEEKSRCELMFQVGESFSFLLREAHLQHRVEIGSVLKRPRACLKFREAFSAGLLLLAPP
jgi:hypothetical protein